MVRDHLRVAILPRPSFDEGWCCHKLRGNLVDGDSSLLGDGLAWNLFRRGRHADVVPIPEPRGDLSAQQRDQRGVVVGTKDAISLFRDDSFLGRSRDAQGRRSGERDPRRPERGPHQRQLPGQLDDTLRHGFAGDNGQIHALIKFHGGLQFVDWIGQRFRQWSLPGHGWSKGHVVDGRIIAIVILVAFQNALQFRVVNVQHLIDLALEGFGQRRHLSRLEGTVFGRRESVKGSGLGGKIPPGLSFRHRIVQLLFLLVSSEEFGSGDSSRGLFVIIFLDRRGLWLVLDRRV
mmetsp:Transcript_22765/g.63283  ORF Transcript_22765/g.63283 Transcript_22765/m.63283 type:complete len:290 (+) Transcript_22765:2926-3795(+)